MALLKRPLFGTKKRSIQFGTEGSFQPPALLNFGVSVSPNAALRITAYYAGVRLISENIASLPKRVLRVTEGGKMPDTSDPVYSAINRKPNEYTNVFDFWFSIIAWLLNRGDAYAYIERNWITGEIKLHQIHPDYVRVSIVNGHKYYIVNHPDPDFQFLNRTYSDYEMLHFMQFTMDGIVGLNPVMYNAIALNKGMAIEKFIADYFSKGGDKRAVLETDSNLGDDAYNQFIKHFNSTGAGDTPLLEYGIKYKQVNVDPVTAALIESEIFSIDDIARMLNIPPHMLAEMSKSTFSNIEHQTIQFVEYTLRPIVKRLEVELETKLYSASDVKDIKFVLDGLLRGDTDARTKFYHGAVLDGYMTRNEVRRMEGLPDAEGLDEFLYPANEFVVNGSQASDPAGANAQNAK